MARCQQGFADVKTGLECGDLQMKEQNGQYGPPRHGKREKISMSRIYCCGVQGCKNKVRFLMAGCFHKFCGHCLYEMEVIVNFVTHEPKSGFACPECAYIERGDVSNTRWVFKDDVYSFLQEKNICLCCFQIKTLDVLDCKHGICFDCIKGLLDDKNLHEYMCVMSECQAKYSREEITKMYERTITEMSWKLFEMPATYHRQCTSCGNLAVIQIRKCYHRFCWDCIMKCTSNDTNRTNCYMMKCSIQDCPTWFPEECLEPYYSHITSTMQLANLYTELVTITTCNRCNQFINQLLVKFHPCGHKVCLPCYEKFMLDCSHKRETMHLGFPMEMKRCPIPSCEKEIPSACLKAIEMATKGDKIAITMYFQHPKRNKKVQCSSCNVEIACMELLPCKHELCKSCMEVMYSASKEFEVAACKTCRMRVLAPCLRTVLEKPFGELLVNDRNYFEELTKNAESELVDTEFQDIGAYTGASATPSVTDGNSTLKINSKDRNTDLLCPSYKAWTRCSCCLQMAVIIFTTCSHGWCLKCLKFLINSQKEGKLQCKDCTSCGSIGNAKRCIRKYEAEGLLVSSYLKPVGGSTCCNKCRKKQAILEEIDCGHRFCESCWCMYLQFRCLKCPVLTCETTDIGNQEPSKTTNANRICDICSRKKSEFAMKKCGHTSCRDCIFRVVLCPVKGCNGYMDEASCEVMSKHIKMEKEVLFLSKQLKTTDFFSVCSGEHCVKHDESETKVQVRRCKHIICNQCFVNIQEIVKDTGISTCPAKDCAELFFLPLSHSTGDHTTESEKEDHYIKSKVPKESNESADKRSENATDSTLLQNGKEATDTEIFSFRKYRFDKNGVRQRGLPNLGFTCYRNSVFQVLAESPTFLHKLRETTNDSKEDWTFTLCEIIWQIYSKSTSRADIEYWLNRMQAEFTAIDNSFVEYRQNDSLSFLTSILSGVADEMQNKRQKYKEFEFLSDPSEIFKGQIHDKYTCCKCKKTENHGESDFFSLPLPALESGTPKIGECLYQFFTTETLRDVFPCTYCKHDTVLKEIQIKKYPKVLVLQLGMISERRDRFERVQQPPRFWENFKGLSNRIHLSKIDKKEFSKYTLYGVIVHTGGLTGGHYYAYVKRLESEKWERCDDSYVKEVDVKEVLRSNAYILLYHK